MLSHMPKSVFNVLAALTVAIPVVAWSTLPRVHNVRSQSVNGVGEYIGTQSTYHPATGGNATFSWQEGTLHGFGNIQVKTKTDTYEFKLVRLSSASAADVYGEWDLHKNGGPLCAGCTGYLFVSPPEEGTHYFKGYVHTQDKSASYSFGGNVTSHFEY